PGACCSRPPVGRGPRPCYYLRFFADLRFAPRLAVFLAVFFLDLRALAMVFLGVCSGASRTRRSKTTCACRASPSWRSSSWLLCGLSPCHAPCRQCRRERASRVSRGSVRLLLLAAALLGGTALGGLLGGL